MREDAVDHLTETERGQPSDVLVYSVPTGVVGGQKKRR